MPQEKDMADTAKAKLLLCEVCDTSDVSQTLETPFIYVTIPCTMTVAKLLHGQ